MPSPEKFKKSLEKFGIGEDIISQINEGYEDIVDKAPKKNKSCLLQTSSRYYDWASGDTKTSRSFWMECLL